MSTAVKFDILNPLSLSPPFTSLCPCCGRKPCAANPPSLAKTLHSTWTYATVPISFDGDFAVGGYWEFIGPSGILAGNVGQIDVTLFCGVSAGLFGFEGNVVIGGSYTPFPDVQFINRVIVATTPFDMTFQLDLTGTGATPDSILYGRIFE